MYISFNQCERLCPTIMKNLLLLLSYLGEGGTDHDVILKQFLKNGITNLVMHTNQVCGIRDKERGIYLHNDYNFPK